MHHITITAVRRFIRARTHLWARTAALSLLVVILGGLPAACGEAVGGAGDTTPTPTPPAQDPITHPTGPDDLVLQVDVTGGLVGPYFFIDEVPAFVLYGDGTLIVDAPGDTTIPGSDLPLPNLQARRLSEDGIQIVLRAARDAGLLEGDKRLTAVGIYDAAFTIFTTVAGGQSSVVSAYALGFESSTEPDMTEDERAARTALHAFWTALRDLDSMIPPDDIVSPKQPYTIERLQIVRRIAPDAMRHTEPDSERELRDWPLDTPLAGFGVPWFQDGMQCGIVSGADLDTLLTALSGATYGTLWASGDEQWVLIPRPVYPHEQGCAPRP